jgi:uncharacterized membrane protein
MSKKGNAIIWILAIVTLIILILGGVFFGVYHKSDKHHDLSSVGLGLLITGSILLIVTVVYAVVHHHKLDSTTSSPVLPVSSSNPSSDSS